jgi:hypothetical protein
MACPSGSAINMLGIARENVYDNYSSTSTPSTPYAISDLVTGGNSGGSGTSFDGATTFGGYSFGDPPGNEVSFSNFWGYDHDGGGWTATFGAFDIAESQIITKTCDLVGGSGDVDLSIATGPPGAATFRYSTGGTYSAYGTSFSNINFSAGQLSIQFKGALAGPSTITRTFTCKSNNASSGVGKFTANVKLEANEFMCIHNSIPVNISINETKYIHQLSVGDSILSYNIEEDIIEETEVLGIETPQHDNLYKIIFDDNQELLLTDDHPIFRLDNTLVSIKPDDTARRYKLNTNELVVGDKIRTMNDSKKIISFERYRGEHDTYTIFTKNNNFYADGILAHSEISE